jgi:tight adherence protein C
VTGGRALPPLAAPERLERLLEAAGRPYGVDMRRLLAVKIAAAASTTAAALAVGASAPGRLGVLLVLAAPVAGFVAPDMRLARMARARVSAALEELPDMLDLLRVTVAAGSPPVRALAAVGAEFHGPLAGEWRRVALLVELGEPLDRALGSVERRLPCEEVSNLAASIAAARRLGTPLGPALAAQALEARHRRLQRIREQAARAGPKVQLVVALVLVPSVLLFVAAALLANLTGVGLGMPV